MQSLFSRRSYSAGHSRRILILAQAVLASFYLPVMLAQAMELSGDTLPAACKQATCYLPGLVVIGKSPFVPDLSPTITTGPTDRYGRIAINAPALHRAMLMQGQVLAGGPWPFDDPDSLYRAERQAEDQKTGLWRAPKFLVTPTLGDQSTWKQRLGQFVILRGPLVATGDSKTRLFLNFGADWKTDMSVSLSKEVLSPKQIDFLQALQPGQQIEARGWLESRNGPMLDLLHSTWLRIDGAPLPD